MKYGLPEWWGAGLATALLLMLVYWQDLAQRHPQLSRLERIQSLGTLRVGVPVDLGIDHAAFQDLHHSMLREFANRLDVNLELVEGDSQTALLDMLTHDEVDIVVPGQPLPNRLPGHLRQAPTYADSQTHVACGAHVVPPADVFARTDLRQLWISDGDGYTERLAEAGLKRVRLAQVSSLGSVALLEQVAGGEVPCTLAERHQIERARQRMPMLKVGASVGPPGGIGWVLRKMRDDSLSQQVDRFMLKARSSGLLAQLRLQERGLRKRFDVVDLRGFQLAMATKLPLYEDYFRRAGASHGIDWRLLAALGYQESRWNPRAISPQGARGLMMLMAPTARQVGISNRLDPHQSITASARYLARLRDDFGDAVPEPDRTWLAVAAYNLGPNKLARARQSVRASGGNPDRWVEVRQALPAYLGRGTGAWEPVFHVEGVRRYFALLSLGRTEAALAVSRVSRPAVDASAAGGSRSGQGRIRRRSGTG